MGSISICRLCLNSDKRTCFINNTVLQETWEKLTDVRFDINDGRPLLVCYICCAQLRNSHLLRQRALKAQELFTKYIVDNDFEGSKKLESLIVSKTYDIDYNYAFEEQYSLECMQKDPNAVEVKEEIQDEEDIDNKEFGGKLFVYTHETVAAEEELQEDEIVIPKEEIQDITDHEDAESDNDTLEIGTLSEGEEDPLRNNGMEEIVQKEVQVVLEKTDTSETAEIYKAEGIQIKTEDIKEERISPINAITSLQKEISVTFVGHDSGNEHAVDNVALENDTIHEVFSLEEEKLDMEEDQEIYIKEEKDDELFQSSYEIVTEGKEINIRLDHVYTDETVREEELHIEDGEMDIKQEEDHVDEYNNETFTVQEELHTEEDMELYIKQESDQLVVFTDEKKFIAEQLYVKGVEEHIKEENKGISSMNGNNEQDVHRNSIYIDIKNEDLNGHLPNNGMESFKCITGDKHRKNELTEVKKQEKQLYIKKVIKEKLPLHINETIAEEEKELVMAEDNVINIKEEIDDKLSVDNGETVTEEELHIEQNNDMIIKEEKEQLFVFTDNITKVGEELDIEYEKTNIKQEEGQLFMYDKINSVEEELDTEEHKEIAITQREDDLFQFTDENKCIVGELNMKGVKKINIKEEQKDSLIVKCRNSTDDPSKKVVVLYHRPCSQTMSPMPNADVKIAKTPAQLEREYRARQKKEIQAAKEALLLLKRTKPGAKFTKEHKARSRSKNLSTARQGCAEPSSAADISYGSMSTNKDNLTSKSKKEESEVGRSVLVRGSATVGGVRHTRWTKELNEVCLSIDRRMCAVTDTVLQEMWEKLTNTNFNTIDGKPLFVCYICCAQLTRSHQLMRRALKAEELLTTFISNGLEQSKELISLMASQLNEFEYNCSIEHQPGVEIIQYEINKEDIKEEKEQEIEIHIKEEVEGISDSNHELNADNDSVSEKDSDSDLPLRHMSLKNLLERKVELNFPKVATGTSARKRKLNEIPQKLTRSHQLMRRALKAEELLTTFISNGLEQSKELISLMASQLNEFEYNCSIEHQASVEIIQYEINKEEIKEEKEREIEMYIKEEVEGNSDSNHEMNAENDSLSEKDSDSDLPLRHMSLKNLLERKVELNSPKVATGTPSRKPRGKTWRV
ncbi:hypothetical protein K1T71_000769 [Dendrolimus kikuchii]|uniref:Uncharacterized protein n=1 Tax=Dendrolimus kikuchii TaxID=765133 RepID=A0ACC1DKC7_9NEOP|nr:hypothetical protein K1T71_000769 [Dendrolimus kikuchii]